ncbi:CinA family protein [Patescibacteria group bacterium]|nr:CinA family protein [Patescibacteria group bacterium]MBU1757714.1 CinA family protein [Patescibacteria group bacterium]MBU1959590.1 CinA family protein [bacterium]
MLEFIKQTLTNNKLKIAVAESLTAGHLQTILSSIS